MAMDKDIILKEYDWIRQEIMDKIKLQNTLMTFTVTTCVAIIAFGLSSNNPYILLSTYCVIIPMSIRIKYYRFAMVKLSAYQTVYIEKYVNELNWETRNKAFINMNSRKKNKMSGKRKPILIYTECMVLAIATYVVYFFQYYDCSHISALSVFNLIWPIGLVSVEIYITLLTNAIELQRGELEKQWHCCMNKQNHKH